MVSSSLGFRVQNLVFHHPDLPDEFENIRALFVADIHPRRDEVTKRLYTFLKDRSYDLVLFGGDYQCGLSPITLECYKELLKVINAPKSRMGSFGCLGNHDSDDLISYLGEDTDVVFEENASVEIAPNFHISMLGDAWDRKDKPAITTANIPANTFNLCLSHSPDTAHEASAHGVSIQLSGHTHGGQIVMPLVGALMKRTRRDRRLYLGEFRINHMLLHVSPGYGTSALPIRIGSPASISEITIKKGALHRNNDFVRRIWRDEKWFKRR